jgi:TolB-like protein/cytochrome c-type biogenesis protein CcmH/NrfG
MSFFKELQQRNVLRVAAAYVVASWLIIQVVETLFPVFGLSDAAIRVVVIVLAIGLFPILIFSWAFEITPEGLKFEKDVDREASTTPQTGKKLDRIIMMVLALALGYFAIDKFVLDPARDLELVEETVQEARTDALLESYGDKSIAVLPFVDMSPEGDQEYMSDGIAEELLNLLAKIPELRVVSRSSTFAFKGKEINIPNVARQLNVAYVLEGSVRLAGDQLRITTQLIEAGTDTHLWSETYDRKLENIFLIQDEISAHVVDELKITLLGELPRSQQINEQAYRMALQARFFWNRRAEGDAEAAFKLYQQAIELAPDYAPAWAGISVAYRDRARRGMMPQEEANIQARKAAKKALELDPKLADAHIRMGQQYAMTGDYQKQLKAYQTALELEPNNSTALAVMGQIYSREGKLEEALIFYQQAEAVDPMGALWPRNSIGPFVWFERWDEALSAAERAYKLSERDSLYWQDLAYIYLAQGRHEDVLLAVDKLPEELSEDQRATALMHRAIALNGLDREEEARKLTAEILAMNYQYEDLTLITIHAHHGNLDEAFTGLEEASSQYPRHFIENEPYLKNLVNDPRWEPTLNLFKSIYDTSD